MNGLSIKIRPPIGAFDLRRIDALRQQLEEPLTIVPDATTSVSLDVENDRFVLRR